MTNAIESFKTAMQTYHLNPPDTIQPGKFNRFPGFDRKQDDDAGWCILFDDELGGVFGDFSTGLDEHWRAENELTYTLEERQSFHKRCEAERKTRGIEQRQQHEAAAAQANPLDADRFPVKWAAFVSGSDGRLIRVI